MTGAEAAPITTHPSPERDRSRAGQPTVAAPVIAVVGVLAVAVTAVIWPEWIRWRDENGEVVESSGGWRLAIHLAIALAVVVGIVVRRSDVLGVAALGLVVAIGWSLLGTWLIEQQSDSTVLATSGRNAWWVAALFSVVALVGGLAARQSASESSPNSP